MCAAALLHAALGGSPPYHAQPENRLISKTRSLDNSFYFFLLVLDVQALLDRGLGVLVVELRQLLYAVLIDEVNISARYRPNPPSYGQRIR